MRTYEILFFTRPDVEDEKLAQIMAKYQEAITKAGGVVKTSEKWGKRRLAYEIDDLREGLYVIMTFEGPNSLPREIDRAMRMDQDIVRHMISRVEQARKRAKRARTAHEGTTSTQVAKEGETVVVQVEKEPEAQELTAEKPAQTEPVEQPLNEKEPEVEPE